MMSPEETGNLVAICSRMLERLVIAGAGLLSIYLGFRLFFVSSSTRSSGEFKAQSFAIKLTAVGPGVFFSAFGTSLLIYLASSTINVNGPILSASTPSHFDGAVPPISSEYNLSDYAAVYKAEIKLRSMKPEPFTRSTIEVAVGELRDLRLKMLTNLEGVAFAEWYMATQRLGTVDPIRYAAAMAQAKPEWQTLYRKVEANENAVD